MITLLLGTDSLAKKQHIFEVAQERKAEVETFTENSTLPPLAQLFEQQLFGAPKVVVLDHLWKQLDSEALLEQVGDDTAAALFIVEDSLDKRLKTTQAFIKDRRVTVVQLDAPVGTQAASNWIQSFAKQHSILIEPAASLALARALLIDEDSSLDVARAQTELHKLKAYASGQAITATMVGDLTENITGVDIFELLNAIATKNKKQAMQMLGDYFATETGDEKANAIKVAALLADQFRSLSITIDAANRRMPDPTVLEITGWKSGRLFIMKKLARNFNAQQVGQALSKLENLDRELKTGSLPPHVVLDLIIADM
jgi:DNA polymerase-3 subunit delta